MPKLYSGSELLLESLRRQQVEVFFGLPGGAVLPLYDALYSAGIRHLLVRHEQAAAFAADGYARVTGKPGVCLGTSGPGATNLITGLTSAMMDSIPVVALTGQVPLSLIGKDAFQEADTIGISLSATKQSFLVRSAAEVPGVIQKAFQAAVSGRPGPVLVDLPKSVLIVGLGIFHQHAFGEIHQHRSRPPRHGGLEGFLNHSRDLGRGPNQKRLLGGRKTDADGICFL